MAASNVNEGAAQTFVDRENPGHGSAQLTGWQGRAVFYIAIAFTFFQIVTAAFSPLPSQVLRSVHVGFLLLLTFVLFRFSKGRASDRAPWYDWLLGLTGFLLAFYHWVFEADLIQRAGDPILADIVVGAIVVLLVIEGARRIMGWELPLICAAFIPYAIWGRELPSFMMHRGFDLEQVIDVLYLGTEGIYGTPTFVSATFIFLFILFGALLERAGMIQLFNDIALGTVGHQKGGPAKVSVISSGLMGTINGSGVANVLTTGQFTIKLMMRFGYRPQFAGAVEACASMGGQIMPPVMGAVAFIMAETIGVPYSEIALAAVIPALLYFGSAFWMVHLEAGRRNLVGMPKSECPSAWAAIRRQWYLLLPLFVLVFLLFSGFTPLFSGTIGMALTAVLILGQQATAGTRIVLLRVAFWVALGLAAYLLYSVVGLRIESAVVVLVGLLVAGTWFVKGGLETQKLLMHSFADAAKGALGVGMACALVGILIGIMQMTGLANDIARGILAVAGDNLLLALVMTMVVCLILGTGLPTIPNYIITSAMAAPVLLEMGVPLIVSHMFVFYFGIMADLTPPVALAALAASSIARESHMKIAVTATKIGIAGYVVPFMAVYTPALMLQGGTWFDTGYVLLKAVVSVALWGGAASAWLIGPMSWLERIWATAAAFLLVLAMPITDEVGFALAASVVAFHWWKSRRSAVRPAES
ncbi:MAG TPA: TRAP transporter permease [Ferrovibrio sp.]|uniref:TRAP transporter permease n=1 Tax=Ferrovibrio sp. TaxID=1917215 RepID=UPI002B4B8B4B|nr:TRAP transporter permease [Ferrovibrio sp.]HLT78648.1 TRAP transporter permease [Ferrovibrio sp.]